MADEATTQIARLLLEKQREDEDDGEEEEELEEDEDETNCEDHDQHSALPDSNDNNAIAEVRYRHEGPRIDLLLSRRSYAAGTRVVGTVRLLAPRWVSEKVVAEGSNAPRSETEATTTATASSAEEKERTKTSARSVFSEAYVYVVGRCRVDSRWHDAKSIAALYGTHPLFVSSPCPNLKETVEDLAVRSYWGGSTDSDAPNASSLSSSSASASSSKPASSMPAASEIASTVCFWSTNVLPLHQLPLHNRRSSMPPQPTFLNHEEWMTSLRAVGTTNDTSPSHNNSSQTDASSDRRGQADAATDRLQAHCLEQTSPTSDEQMIFTFSAQLPQDAPPTANTACARYSYAAVVCARVNGEMVVYQAPFSVYHSRKRKGQGSAAAAAATKGSGRVKVGTCIAMAHSPGEGDGLVAILSSPTATVRPSRLSVNRGPHLSSDVRTIRIAGPLDQTCCIMTLVGTTTMNPGGRLLLHFEFPQTNDEEDEEDAATVLPCHLVSACLRGEEVACLSSSSAVMNTPAPDGAVSKRNKTRTHVYDTAYRRVEPSFTEAATLSLVLPMECRPTFRTDLVEVTVSCKVDITVERASSDPSSATPPQYDVLGLEVPVEVVPSTHRDENVDEEDIAEGGEEQDDDANLETNTTQWEKRIRNDLSWLSLKMKEMQ